MNNSKRYNYEDWRMKIYVMSVDSVVSRVIAHYNGLGLVYGKVTYYIGSELCDLICFITCMIYGLIGYSSSRFSQFRSVKS
jgi:hypothetical protein